MTISKKTLSIFKKNSNILKDTYIPQIAVIVEILQSGGVICGNAKEGFEVCEESFTVIGCIHNDYSRRIVSGMAIRFPRYIQATLTHGNNQVAIVGDINKLVKAIVQ